MIGTLYGLLGSTLTLMFRSTGILSFAHAGFALIGAYLYSGFACPSTEGTNCGNPKFSQPWIAALVCIAVTTVAGLIVERLVIRPLQYADVVRKSIATAAVLGLSSGLMLQVYGPQPRGVPQDQQLFPNGSVTIADVVIDNQRIGILLVAGSVMTIIALMLSRSWFGLGVRAAGQRPDVVRLFGVKPAVTSRFNWALGGALSGLAGVLIAPISVVNVGTFSFLLVKAVAAALIGGLVSLPLTFAGGLLLGAVEALTPRFFDKAGSATVGIAVVVMISVVVNRRQLAAFTSNLGLSGASTQPPGKAVTAIARFTASWASAASRVPTPLWLLGLTALAIVPMRDDYYGAIGLNVLFYALLALSLVLPAGDAGQPTFLQIGFAGISAYTVSTLNGKDVPYGLAVLIAISLAVLAGLAVGAVILRFRGAAFAVLSLTFAAVISDFILNLNSFEQSASTPTFLGMDLLSSKRAFLIALFLFALSTLLVYNFRRSGVGLSLRTLREGPRLLSTFGINAGRLEITAFALSAGIAGAAGVVYSLLVSSFTTFQFIPLIGVIVLLAGFVGGLRSLSGPLIAGLIFGYGPILVAKFSSTSDGAFPQIASSSLALVLVVIAPGGLASLGDWARDVVASSGSRHPAVSFRGAAVLPEAFAPGTMDPKGSRRKLRTDTVARPALRRRSSARTSAPPWPGRLLSNGFTTHRPPHDELQEQI